MCELSPWSMQNCVTHNLTFTQGTVCFEILLRVLVFLSFICHDHTKNDEHLQIDKCWIHFFLNESSSFERRKYCQNCFSPFTFNNQLLAQHCTTRPVNCNKYIHTQCIRSTIFELFRTK